jgi:hypothetical protein
VEALTWKQRDVSRKGESHEEFRTKDCFGETAEEPSNAFDRYAPHFEGDEKYDSRWLAKQTVG